MPNSDQMKIPYMYVPGKRSFIDRNFQSLNGNLGVNNQESQVSYHIQFPDQNTFDLLLSLQQESELQTS